MSRGIFEHVVQGTNGDIPAIGTVVMLLENDGTTPLAQALYTAASGGVPLGATSLATDSRGRVQAFAANGQYMKASVGGALTQTAIWPDPGQMVTLTGTQILTNKTLTDPTVTGTLTGGRLLDKGGAFVNVQAFGTNVGNNANDATDSNAIDAAVAYIKAQALLMSEGRLGTLFLPPGRYNLIRPVDLTGVSGLWVLGGGPQATVFGIATNDGRGSTAATLAYWAAKSMMDITGSNFMRLMNFTIEPNNTTGANAIIPQCGLLAASNAPFTNWHGDAVPANQTNANYFDHVRVSGAFLKACHVSYANVSSTYYRCDFHRYASPNTNPTYQNGVNMNEAALVLSRDNLVGISSAGAVGIANYATDGVQNSDLTFNSCEVHDSVGAGGVTCNCPAIWIEEGYSIRFRDGNWSGRGNPCGYLRLSPGKTGGGTLYGCKTILIDGVQMYEGDAIAPAYAPATAIRQTGNVADNAGISRALITSDASDPTYAMVASDVTIRNCAIKVVNSGTLLGGGRSDSTAGSAYFIRWHVENVSLQESGTTNTNPTSAYLVHNGASDVAEFRDSYLEANTLQLDLNGGTAKRGRIVKVGNVVAGTTITHGDSQRVAGGAVALAASGTAFYGVGSANATEANVVVVTFGQATRVWNLRATTATAPGGVTTLTCTARKGTPGTLTDTALVAVITGAATNGSDLTHAVSFAAGDTMTFKVVALAGTVTNAWMSFSWSESAD